MKEIVDRLKENREIELAKSILESKGYRVSKRKSIKESRLTEGPANEGYWALSIDAKTNAPGTHYYGGERSKIGEQILKKIDTDLDVSVETLGYDDITFVVNSTKDEALRFGVELAKVVEPSEDPEYEGSSVSVVGPYDDPMMEEFDNQDVYEIYQNGRIK